MEPEQLIVVTMDQRASRSGEDVVGPESRRLNERFGEALRRRFVRLAGDEMQAAADDGAWLVDLLLDEARAGRWWIGVGIGTYDAPLGRTARDSRGEAFYRARDAVALAKQRPWGFALAGERVEDAEACLALLARLVRTRTPAQQEAVDLLRAEGQTRLVAARLGVSVQAASQRIRGAGIDEERVGRRLAARLLVDAGY